MRDPLYWLPIKYKLPLTFAGICVAAFGVGGYVVASFTKQALEEQILSQLDERAAITAMTVDRKLELLGRRVEDFASDGFIRTQLEILSRGGGSQHSPLTPNRLVRHLKENKLPLVDCFVDAFLLDKGGRPLLAVHSEKAPRSNATLVDRLWYGPLAPPSTYHPYPTFLLFTPVLNLNSKDRIGYLQILIRADTWVESLHKSDMLPGAIPYRSWLTDRNNRTLHLSGQAGLGQGEADSVERETSSHIGYSRVISQNGWRVDLLVDRAQAMHPIDMLWTRLSIAGGVILLVVLGLLFFPSRFLVKPLSELRDSAQRIAQGDLSTRVATDTRDEIGDLSHAFNTMANAVGERTRKLEETAAELERSEAEMRAEHDKLQSVIRSMHDGLFMLDGEGRVTLSNKAAQPIVSALTREQKPLREPSDCVHNDGQVGDCLNCLSRISGLPHLCEIPVDDRMFEIYGMALPSGNGMKAGRLFVARDITERRAQASRHAYQERMAVLGQVAAVMAHELNNPLAAIAMFSQMLESELEEGTSQRESAEIIRRNTESCKETIRMLLDSTAHAASDVSMFNMHDLLGDIRQFLRPLFERSGAELEIDSAAADPVIYGDRLQLRQVLVNLLMNAMQAGGAEEIKVHVRTEDGEGDLAIRVQDNGPGIPALVREHIFKPFFTTKPPGVGTGLGLPTSKRIVEAHGGVLRLAESSPGRTVFQITLPRRSSPKARNDQALKSAASPQAPILI